MPPRGKAPGLKRGRHNLPYWIARQVARDIMDFPDKCIALDPRASDDELAEACRQHTARLNRWIEEHQRAAGDEDGQPLRYDGTVFAACQVYQQHPASRFHRVKANTRKTYTDSLKLIERTVGKRLIRNLTVFDVQHWYEQWRLPAVKDGPERVDRAHDAVSMFKTVLRFNAALRRPECKQLIAELEELQFERGGAREQEMTYQQAAAFVRTALELGGRNVVPADRALSLAIGVAAQFELLLRQKDIIGERPRTEADLRKAIASGATAIPCSDGSTWCGWFTWENIPGWRWRMKTSKSKYRAAATFDLTQFTLLHPLLERVPHARRSGAIVTGERGEPVVERSYRKWFRPIARAAGIPDEVWLMDTRAGGITEAEEAGAELASIQQAATHSEKDTTLRYIRRRERAIAEVAEARKKGREGE